MMLKFYAKDDLLVSVPFQRPFIGQLPRYVGRTQFEGGRLPAVEEPFKADSHTRMGMRLVKLCRRGSLWPADKQTAAHCRVPFTSVSFADGVWAKAKPSPRKSTTRTTTDKD